jgi:hypothetical protein
VQLAVFVRYCSDVISKYFTVIKGFMNGKGNKLQHVKIYLILICVEA